MCGYGCRTVQSNGTACCLLATVEKAAWQRRIAAALGIQPVQKTWPFGGPHFVSGVRTQNCLRVDSKSHGLRAAILDFFGKRSSAMWTAFRGRGDLLIFLRNQFFSMGAFLGPAVAGKARPLRGHCFPGGVKAVRGRAMLLRSRAKPRRSGDVFWTVAATFPFRGLVDKHGGAALHGGLLSLRTSLELARCAARHALCVCTGFDSQRVLLQAGVPMRWTCVWPLTSRWRLRRLRPLSIKGGCCQAMQSTGPSYEIGGAWEGQVAPLWT